MMRESQQVMLRNKLEDDHMPILMPPIMFDMLSRSCDARSVRSPSGGIVRSIRSKNSRVLGLREVSL